MTFDTSADNLARMAAQGLRLDPPPTEAEIDEILARLAQAFGSTAAETGEARKLLHSRFSIHMDKGQTIKDVEHTPWLDARREQIDPFYWNRYHQFLLRSGWPPLVAATLDRSMNELLDLLGDPARSEPWKRRGLVVGDVQSGKTASYAALICKAADAGYRMVILLAGTLENVRRQTQERLDGAFVGLDSRDFLSTSRSCTRPISASGTSTRRATASSSRRGTRTSRAGIVSALNISLNAVKEPVLVVAKKNKSVLSNLANWLRSRNADLQGHIDLPLLLIDDEADNASINTRNRPKETTAINKAIRDLLALFTRSSYVGFTATPFANIFVDPTSTDEMLGDDLFPRDFIHLLEPPTNYVGMDRPFPPADPESPEQDALAREAGLRTVEDSDAWLAVDHKQEAVPGPVPQSLRDALNYFLLACPVRDLRVKQARDGREKGIHRSMLVNVSRFTSIQNQVADQLHVELDAIRQQVRLYGKLDPAKAAANSPAIARLAELFREEMPREPFTWAQVLDNLHESISPIRVQPVNQRTGAASLDYGITDAPPGVRVIAVGGNSLSRGLTLEGLCVSYFLRNSKAYDTLLQMGRWFGYRDGYQDLCRLWLTADAERWYRHVAEATNELKRDFARMRRQRATPAEFGLRVRTHPDTLLITARNKMATGVNIVGEVKDISLAGRGIETSRLFADRQRNEQNFRIADRFLLELSEGHGAPARNTRAAVWHAIPAGRIARFLTDFLVHPLNHDFQGDAIAEFLAKGDDPQMASWTVALPVHGDTGPVTPALGCGIPADAKRRVVTLRETPPQSLLVSGKSSRVGSRTDVHNGLPQEQVQAIIEAEREKKPGLKEVPEDVFRAAMQAPLLVIYLLRGFQREPGGTDETPYKEGLILPALGLHFPGVNDPAAPRRYVSYRLNRVAQGELEIDGDDLGDDDGDD